MESNNTYEIEDIELSTILDTMDSFITKMDNFIITYPSYSYEVSIEEDDGIWLGKIKVNKDE